VRLKFINHLAKFTDLDASDESFEAPSGSVTTFPNNRMIVGSRMNDMSEDAPF
jgi:hypothetical protein